MNNSTDPDEVVLQEATDAKEATAVADMAEKIAPASRVDFNKLQAMPIIELRKVAREMNVHSPTTQRKDDLILSILSVQALQMGFRF